MARQSAVKKIEVWLPYNGEWKRREEVPQDYFRKVVEAAMKRGAKAIGMECHVRWNDDTDEKTAGRRHDHTPT